MAEIQLSNQNLSNILKVIEELTLVNDLDTALNSILHQTRKFCHADAGSIFLLENRTLKFSYFQNDTLAKRDATSDRYIYTNLEIPVNENSIAGYCALYGKAVNLPDVSSIGTQHPFKFNPGFDHLLNYQTKSVLTVPLITSQHKIIGVMQIINAQDNCRMVVPFSQEAETLACFLAVNAAAILEKTLLTREMILRMIRMAEMRDPKETGAHVNRVGAYSVEIYRQWAKFNKIDPDEIKSFVDNLRIAAMLHDVGKVAISDLILKKPAKLDDSEFTIMQTHTTQGSLLFASRFSEIDKLSADIAYCHHEKYDGSGYPSALAGEKIPLAARIVAIADVYDALICRRVYKEPWNELDVIAEIKKQSGKHFDPGLVEYFLQIYEIIKAIRSRYPDES